MVSTPTKASLTGNGIPMYKTLSQIGISYGLGVIGSLKMGVDYGPQFCADDWSVPHSAPPLSAGLDCEGYVTGQSISYHCPT